MRYKRFEDLPVWKLAIELAVDVYELTAKPQFKSRYSLRDQIERAAVSVSNNIAEGFERGTNNELLSFLFSRGSAGEVRSMLCLFERIPDLRELSADLSSIKTKAESCSRQLKAWIRSIQDSSFKGERHVNSQTTRKAQAAFERDQFMKELAEIRARGTQTHGEQV